VGRLGVGFAKDLHTLLQAGSMGRLPAGDRIAEQSRSQGGAIRTEGGEKDNSAAFSRLYKGGSFLHIFCMIPTKIVSYQTA
jgi:hypothetical protein